MGAIDGYRGKNPAGWYMRRVRYDGILQVEVRDIARKNRLGNPTGSGSLGSGSSSTSILFSRETNQSYFRIDSSLFDGDDVFAP